MIRLSSPGADQVEASPSRIPDWDRTLASGLSRPMSVLSPRSPRMSCKVCNSGEELDLLKGCEGWKERSTAGRAPSEEMARSMGIPPAASSSKWDFSSWLDAEDDCKDNLEETLLKALKHLVPWLPLQSSGSTCHPF